MVTGYTKVPAEGTMGGAFQAAIAEADLSFDTATGHDHDGSDSKSITGFVNDVTLGENGIVLDPVLSADGKYSGIIMAGTAGATVSFGDILYLDVSDSEWKLAQADAAATSKGIVGMCVLASTDGQPTTLLMYGKIRAATLPGLTVGAPVHISAATAGDVVVAAPTGTTDFVVRIIGHGVTAEDLLFAPDNTYIELA